MSRRPYFAADPEAHLAFVELAQWRRERDPDWKWGEMHVLQDLRYLENEAKRFFASDGATGQRFPGRRKLAARWGWTDWEVRDFLSKTDWQDPEKPAPPGVLRPRRSSSPGRRPVATRSPPGEEQSNADNDGESTRSPPSRHPVNSTRAFGSNQPNQSKENNPPPNPPPRGRGAAPPSGELIEACRRLLGEATETERQLALRQDSAVAKCARRALEKRHELPAGTRSSTVAAALQVAAATLEARPLEPEPPDEPPEPPPPPAPSPAMSQLWQQTLQVMRERHGHQDVAIWLEHCVLFRDGRLWVPNEYFGAWIGEHYAAELAELLAVRQVELVAGPDPPAAGNVSAFAS